MSTATPAFTISEKVHADQRRAADPAASAWVSANAGAGKTKVLTDRVLRLLLSGAAPGRILCLTFTKAAAANMAMRVFDRLGGWVTLGEDELYRELLDLAGTAPSREEMRRARTLFARAVETPGGLKIDTIHAFCERLLHLAPFEANVPARFAVLDEGQSAELVAEATATVLAGAHLGDDAALEDALDRVSVVVAGDMLTDVLGAALKERAFGDSAAEREATLARLRDALGESDSAASIEAAILSDGLAAERRRPLIDDLARGRATDIERAEGLRAHLAAIAPAEKVQLLFKVFFTDEGRGEARADASICTKSVSAATRTALIAERDRLGLLRERLRAAQAVENTQALFTLAQAVAEQVRRQKSRLGALDFDDLIDRTVALLARDDNQWVLYKLDRGIDHVLVDEAQDTNRRQWQILASITEDFTAGLGARDDRLRTLFAVGDPKQSIFSFQGAEPREFAQAHKRWRGKVEGARLRFEDVALTLSFRSGLAVLSAVDATFETAANFRGLSFDDTAVGTVHESARPHAPGRVEVWPTIEPPGGEPEADAWTKPLDEEAANAPAVIVADRVAAQVRAWTTAGDDTGRVSRPGDILILVRKRGAAFEAVIRALRRKEVPVAGADRLDIAQHIAVLDLVAAGRAALLDADDLTLACALKSPLVGLDEDDLLRIAAGRADGESLAEALRRHAGAGDRAAAAGADALASWRDLAPATGPFGFYASLLGPHGGRARLVARLGSEAGDAIDSFLWRAHEAEQAETPSLTAFLDRFVSAEHTIKRDLDAGRDEVRVMTVHGAKGLEASVVVVIDDCGAAGRDPPLVPVPSRSGPPIPVWTAGGRRYDCQRLKTARQAMRDLALEENNRLLYVAMTRAADRLVVAPFRAAVRNSSVTPWSDMIRTALVAAEADRVDVPVPGTVVWRRGPEATPTPRDATEAAEAGARPDWLDRPAPPEPEPAAPLRPSGALGAAERPARPGVGPAASREARRRGTLMHALLERLPAVAAEQRRQAADSYLLARAASLSAAVRAQIAADVLAVVADPGLAPLFGPGSRAEAAIAGSLDMAGQSVPVVGQIDRIAVLPTQVIVADYKTTAAPPAADQPIPPEAVAQLALYRALLQNLYRDRPVRAVVIYTAGPTVREPTAAELEAALGQIRAARAAWGAA